MRSLPVEDPGTPDCRSALRFMLWLARRQWPSLTLGMFWGIVWMVSQAVVPAVLGRAIDEGVTTGDGRALLGWAALLLVLGVIAALAGILRHRMVVFNWLNAAYRIIQLITRQAGRLGATLPKRMSTGEVVAVGVADISHLGNAMDITGRGAGAVVALGVVAAILLTSSPPLGLIVLIGVPLMATIVGLLLRPLHRRQLRQRELQGELMTRAGDIVAGLRVLRGIGGEELFAGRYRAESQRVRRAGVEVARVESLLEGLEILLPGLLVTVVTWLGARYALAGRISPGELVAFYGYAVFLIQPLRTLTEAADKITKGHVAARRAVRLLRLEPEMARPPSAGSGEDLRHGCPGHAESPKPPSAGSGEDLRHGCPGHAESPPLTPCKPVAAGRRPNAITEVPAGPVWLRDPESGLVVRPGRLTALAAAAPQEAEALTDRLGRYSAAEVTWNGVRLADIPLAAVREHILVSRNDDRLFTGPLRAELDPNGAASDAAVDRALRTACATDIVEALPDGLGARVAEAGREFSGGQQQRLRLARALAADPEVLMLVEPTSAVDAHTEVRIAGQLAAARAGRTTLVCTTSPLVLDRAEHVVYLEGGKVIAEGTHRELLDTEPRYAATVTRGED